MGDLNLNIFGFISSLPAALPLALGAALSFTYRNEARVALTYFGDGSSSEGGCHETLNLAAVWRAPIVFICENNQYAYSTPLSKQLTIENIADRAAGYGMPGIVVDGNDVLAVYEANQAAVDRARRGDGPTLIECKTLRMLGHAYHDDGSYVPRDLLDEWARRDPLLIYEHQLRDMGALTDDELVVLDRRIEAEVDDAVDFAEASPWPKGEDAAEGVYAP
jgi:pyruvate dehydrogenase E1 component alpha subunit